MQNAISFNWLFACLTAWLFLASAPGHAQWQDLRLTKFDATDGLNSDPISSICQDSVGYLYLGGYQQLIRYDGNAFEDFTHEPEDSTSIGPGQVVTLLPGKSGCIWVGMRRDGLNCFDPKTESFNRYRVPTIQNSVHSLWEDENGYIWVGGKGFELHRFDPVAETFESYSPATGSIARSPTTEIRQIRQDISDDNILWLTMFGYRNPEVAISSGYNIVRFDRNDQSFTSFPCVGDIRFQDADGTLWGGSYEKGLWSFNPTNGSCKNFRFDIIMGDGRTLSDGVFDMLRVDSGFWLASNSSVVQMDRKGEYEFIVRSDDLNRVSTMYRDRSNNVWIGTQADLYVLNPRDQQIRFFSLSGFGMHERIYPGRLAYDHSNDAIYLVSKNERRLYYIPLGSSTNSHPVVIEAPFVLQGVAISPAGQIITSGAGALHSFDSNTRKFTPIALAAGEAEIPWTWYLSYNSRGFLCAVTTNEFIWFDSDMSSQRVSFPHPQLQFPVGGSTFGNDNTSAYVWTDSLFHVDLETGAKSRIKAPLNPEGVQIAADGTFWVGNVSTVGRYTLQDDSLHLVRYYTARDGLTNTNAIELHIDHAGRVWIFSATGMSSIDPSTDAVRNFGVLEGLQHPYIDPRQVLNLPDGRIATVNDNGIVVFHPDSLWATSSPDAVPVVLKSLRIAGVPAKLTKVINHVQHVDLKPRENFIDIQFQGLGYPNDRNTTYSYKVLGLRDNWIHIGKNNFVTLSNLRPGSYTFQVKAGPPESMAPVKSISLEVQTPLYRQTWFLFVCALALLAAIIVLLRARVRQIRRQEIHKAEIAQTIAELELKALRSQMNPHFMFNSLNSIKNFILKKDPKRAAEYLSDFAHLIRMILQNSREKTITLQEELDTLILYIELEKLRFDDEFEFSCNVDEGVSLDAVQIPPLILQPFVENAIWHGLMPKSEVGHLALNFAQSNGRISCTIDDDGIGREKAMALKKGESSTYMSIGLGITQDRIAIFNRIDALGIQTEIIDKKDHRGAALGTRVIVQIPVNQSM